MAITNDVDIQVHVRVSGRVIIYQAPSLITLVAIMLCVLHTTRNTCTMSNNTLLFSLLNTLLVIPFCSLEPA